MWQKKEKKKWGKREKEIYRLFNCFNKIKLATKTFTKYVCQ